MLTKVDKTFLFRKGIIFLTMLLILLLTNCSKQKKEKSEAANTTQQEEESYTKTPDKFPSIVYADQFKKSFSVDPIEKAIEEAGKYKIKSRKLYSTSYKEDGSYASKDKLYEEIFFNEKGQRTKHFLYVGVGSSTKVWIYKYDASGNLALTEVRDSKNNLLASVNYKYDKEGREIEGLYYDKNKPVKQIIKYIYDKDGNNVESILLTEKGDTVYKEIAVFESGVMMSSKYVDSRGKEQQTVERTFNPEEITVKEVTTTGKAKKTVYYKFDTEGRLIEIRGNTYRREYQYNDNDDVVTDKLLDEKNDIQYEMKYNYLPNGLLSETIRYDSKGRPSIKSVYKYEFYPTADVASGSPH